MLVYIHGFLGDETSFKSFPAHVHNVLTTTLAETHVVYSKIYPRYKSRKNVSFARDDFSNWLAPHESPTTDVILVGHSLGGILAAEVVLMPGSGDYQYKHRILGTIAVDVPFLGIHPGVVGTGIASLFRSAPEEADGPPPLSTATTPTSPYSDLSTDPADPNFNPTYQNDVHMTNRSGKLNRAWYFWNKHWGELGKATQNYVTSHLEHGGVLADYPGLRRRYDALRGLEDIDECKTPRSASGRYLRRVRFVNYYSASTGRIKERQPSPSSQHSGPTDASEQMSSLSLQPTATTATSGPRTPSPRISLEEHRDGQIVSKRLEEEESDVEHPQTATSPVASLRSVSPRPEMAEDAPSETLTLTTSSSGVEFPPLPPLPDPPAAFEPSRYSNPDALKVAQKEHNREVKAYDRVKKERDKTLREREKLIQKRDKAAEKDRLKKKKEQLKRSATLNADEYDKQLKSVAATSQPNPSIAPKKQRDRKFCSLPSKGKDGKRDPTWVRIYMEGMDEVVAHTSMFKVNETYAKLVGDTVARIEDWVGEDGTRRAVAEGQSTEPVKKERPWVDPTEYNGRTLSHEQ